MLLSFDLVEYKHWHTGRWCFKHNSCSENFSVRCNTPERHFQIKISLSMQVLWYQLRLYSMYMWFCYLEVQYIFRQKWTLHYRLNYTSFNTKLVWNHQVLNLRLHGDKPELWHSQDNHIILLLKIIFALWILLCTFPYMWFYHLCRQKGRYFNTSSYIKNFLTKSWKMY